MLNYLTLGILGPEKDGKVTGVTVVDYGLKPIRSKFHTCQETMVPTSSPPKILLGCSSSSQLHIIMMTGMYRTMRRKVSQ